VYNSIAAARWEGIGFHGESVVMVATSLIPSATGILDTVRVRSAIHDVDPVRTVILDAFRVRATIFDTDPVRSILLNVDLVHTRLQAVAIELGGGGVP
jgi:hypothetical protein